MIFSKSNDIYLNLLYADLDLKTCDNLNFLLLHLVLLFISYIVQLQFHNHI